MVVTGFKFYRTFVKQLPRNIPVTVGFERVSPSLLRDLRGYEHVLMHSGNWWVLSDRERTPARLINALRSLCGVCIVEGAMTINVPPKKATGREYRIWSFSRDLREQALERSLRYAVEMLELARKYGIEVPLYCAYEVGTFEDAVTWFRKALDSGFRAFAFGCAAFLMGSSASLDVYKHLIDVIVGARVAIGEEYPLHASGLASIKLIPIAYYLGVTSADGSTPIRAALSMGIVYDEFGRQYRVRELKQWSCRCRFCSEYKSSELIRMFQESYVARVLHNSYLWDLVIEEMIVASKEGRLEEFIEQRLRDSKLLLKVFDYAKRRATFLRR